MSTTMTVYAYVSDLERMRQFYEGPLGVKPATQQGKWLPFDLGGATFALHSIEHDRVEDVRRFNLSFVVDDVEEAVARFEAQGAKVLRGVADEAFGKRAFIQDPDGRTLEIVQHELP